MRGLKSDLVLLDEAKDFAPYGESPLLRVVKELRYRQLLLDALFGCPQRGVELDPMKGSR